MIINCKLKLTEKHSGLGREKLRGRKALGRNHCSLSIKLTSTGKVLFILLSPERDALFDKEMGDAYHK